MQNSVQLSGEELMISDETGGLCIAGVYGGKHSGVTEATTRIFLESACFNPVAVRKSARQHGLHTDSSFRFERGSDPEITVYALKRAVDLLCQVAGARIASRITDLYPASVPPRVISLDLAGVNKLIGAVIPRDVVIRILTDLGITVSDAGPDALRLEVPAFKVDVTRPADVVEEILRIYGYNAIPLPERLSITPGKTQHPDPEQVFERAALQLSGMGYREILTNSLISKIHTQITGGMEGSPVELLNPLSTDLSIMRHSMLPGALEAIAHNLNRKQDVLQFFEFGKVYSKTETRYAESPRIGIYMTGPIHREHWKGKAGKVDLYRLRASIDALLDAVLPTGRRAIRVEAVEDATFGTAIRMTWDRRELVRAGRIRPEICRASGIDQDV
ncbi:MAG: phenylalanine--tRNA ligase subunit beta, partial [Bacteroidota bacterium]